MVDIQDWSLCHCRMDFLQISRLSELRPLQFGIDVAQQAGKHAPSANLDPTRRFPSMFEPVHGSAPDIAFKGIVNPLATFLCTGQMLQHLGHAEAAGAIERAIARVLAETPVRTPDLGGNSTTSEVTDAVISRL